MASAKASNRWPRMLRGTCLVAIRLDKRHPGTLAPWHPGTWHPGTLAPWHTHTHARTRKPCLHKEPRLHTCPGSHHTGCLATGQPNCAPHHLWGNIVEQLHHDAAGWLALPSLGPHRELQAHQRAVLQPSFGQSLHRCVYVSRGMTWHGRGTQVHVCFASLLCRPGTPG